MKIITVILMVSSECNFHCAYCYSAASRKSIEKFNLDMIEKLVENCSHGFDSVEFCLLGGEPLLVGMNFFKRLIKAQQSKQGKNRVKFANILQSNGSLINKEWLSFFNENGFRLGISFGAPPETHLRHRKSDPNQIIRICQEIKESGMPLKTLCVISKLNVTKAREIFNFYNELGVNSFSLLPLKKVPLPECPEMPTNNDLFSLYRDMFDLWLKTPNRFSSIEPLDTMIRAILGQRPKLCSFNSSCLQKMIAVNQKGEVVPCGSLATENFVLGNIMDQPLLDILFNTRSQELLRLRENHIQKRCKNCEFVAICQGGCRADAFWHSGKYDGEYPYCGARKELFFYIRSRLKKMLKI